jgi:drug/metabolite transporter (DMT)-like permease
VIHLVMVLHGVLSAVTYIAAKRALGELSAFELGLVRFTLAAALYAVMLRRKRVHVAAEDLWGMLLLGILAVPLNQGLFMLGLARTTPGHAALLYALTPVFIFLAARRKLRERASVGKVLGIGLAFAGVLVVLLSRGLMAVRGEGSPLLGDLMILAGVAAWAIYAVWGKPYAERYGAITFTGWSLLFGSLAYLPLGLVASRGSHFVELSVTGWMSVGYLVVFTSVLSYVIFYWALARAEASRVAVWANLPPVLTAILAWLVYGERLTPSFLAGSAMVLAGVFLTQRS